MKNMFTFIFILFVYKLIRVIFWNLDSVYSVVVFLQRRS